ncbi:methyl-accepting chemotaxis protein [Vibrio sp. SCSIO 43137]|uniref:methyl-accepting chemotaxis protein n=1 Tax=Vibrio sp. SCSIO 43137 TaxID=3021011 RepID=UPI002307B2DB|nr:methyl-accepting chemotaxis protein [Vibrio sp. SCSIO 43137]WCE32587.1 methyl-accepting chemotaxis protein [Vibrio sp. SCSIO 43137]
MKNLGFKRLLLISILALVALSVSVSSYISYSKESAMITKMISDSTTEYVSEQAKLVEVLLGEKVSAVGKLAGQFKNKDIEGSPEQIIELTKMVANAANLNSAVIAFKNGDAYWNQTAPTWPDHKYDGDVTTRGWYQAAINANGTSVTDPYLSSDGDVYWISIVEKTFGGMMSVDMKLGFLNEMVSDATKLAGSAAIIMNQDTSILASSSPALKVGEKGADIASLKSVLVNATQQQIATQEYQLNGVDKLMFSKQIVVGDKKWYFVIGLDKDVAFADLQDAKYDAIFVALTACILSVVLAFFVIQALYRPILELKKTITGLSQGDGDLTQRLEVRTKDDLGQIADGVNQFIASLQSMMLEIQNVSLQLQENVESLKGKSTRNAAILESHVSETEQIVAAIEEMNATADAMATDAANTAQLTHKANEASGVSQNTVSQAQTTVSVLVQDVDATAENVQRMSQETDGINAILSVIGEIAEQTNLLALNAAIEAARAGEQGRGFAVVADEVRNLASRTKESTEEIESALSSLLKGNQSVVEAMDTTKERCQETADGMGGVTESLGTMTQFVGDINDLSTQIATAAEEQSSVTQEVSRNMSAISDIVSELDTNSKEALAESETIASVNSSLAAIVGRFKL